MQNQYDSEKYNKEYCNYYCKNRKYSASAVYILIFNLWFCALCCFFFSFFLCLS